jgi:hypothetical protein
MMQIRLTGGDAMLALWLPLLAGCAPLHLWDTHTTSTSRPQSFNVGELTHEPVATFGLLAPEGLQGFNPTLSHALIAALAEASPPIQGVPTRETMNTLNDQRLTAEYADLISGFTGSGVLERERLQRIGSALSSRYVLLPGLTEYNQVIIDRLALSGWKFIQSRVITLRLWLQLWNTQTGQILWESTGEITMATKLLRPERTIPLNEIAQMLWLRMIQDNLVEDKTKTRSLSFVLIPHG